MKSDLYPERAAFWDDLKSHYPADDTANQKTLMKGEL